MFFAQTLKIENKIFKKSDILHIWEEISQNGETELTLTFHDGIECSSKNAELLNDGKMIDYKKCENIKIRYWDHYENKRIDFELDTSQYSSYNYLEVEAKGEHWTLATFTNLNAKINSFPKHPKWIRKAKYRVPIAFLGQIIIQTLSTFPLRLFIFNQGLISLISGILGLTFLIFILLILPLIFPNIEFDFGPKNILKDWRNRLKICLQFIFGTIFFLGIVVGLLQDYAKDYIKEKYLKKPEISNSQNSQNQSK